MRILHFYKCYYPDEYGGVAQFIRQLAEGGRELGAEAEVLTLTAGRPGTIMVDNHRVHRIKRLFKAASTDFSFRAPAEFKRLAAGADIIHYHFPYPLADLAHFFSGARPALATYHSDIVVHPVLRRLYSPLGSRFLGSLKAIVATSPNYVASSPVLAAHAAKIRCIPFGLAPPPPSDAARLEFWRRRLPERFFLFIGGFRYYKGLDFLLTAARNQPYPLALLGGGGLEKHLRARAAAEGLANVHFLGAVADEDKEALLSLCYGLVLPSHLRSEAFGLVLLEGARRAKPLVCCEIASGSTYVNIDGETGLAVPPANPEALRAALARLWEDQALAARLGAGARRRFEALFTLEKMVAGYLELYRELLAGPKPPGGKI